MASGGIPSAGYWMGPAMVPLWAPGWGVAALAPLAADEVEAESGADDAHAAVRRIASVASPYSQPAGSSGRDAGSDLIILARWFNAPWLNPLRLEHRPFGGRADECGVSGEHASPVVRLGWGPGLQPVSDVDLANLQPAALDVDLDHVAVLQGRQRAAHRRLRGDVADHQTAGRA